MTDIVVDGFSPSVLAEYLLRSIPSNTELLLSSEKVKSVDPLIETSAINAVNVSEVGGTMEQTISILSPTQGVLSGENVMLSRGNISILNTELLYFNSSILCAIPELSQKRGSSGYIGGNWVSLIDQILRFLKSLRINKRVHLL